MMSQLPSVRATGIIIYRIVNDIYQYLLLQASNPPHHWTPPKGHVESGEDDRTCAIREAEEESSINSNEMEFHEDFKETLQYQVKENSDNNEEINVQKTVVYFLARFIGNRDLVLSHEHQDLKWAQKEEAMQLVGYHETANMINNAHHFLQNLQTL